MVRPNFPNYGQPVDTGWSWVICFASFISYFLIGVSGQALSVLFLELVVQYKASLTVTSLTIMIQILFLSISSIVVVSVLVPKFGERKVTVVAGVIFAGCSVGCSLAPDIVVFIIFCAIQGLTIGAVLIPVIGILNFYFDRRLSLAMSISSSGLCVSTIVSPPFIRALMEAYGLRGTFLFLAGLELHMVVAGMLLRPMSCYRNKGQLEKKLLNEKEDNEQNEKDIPRTSIISREDINQPDGAAYSELTNHNSSTSDAAREVILNHDGIRSSEDVRNGQNSFKNVPTGNKRLIKERPSLRRLNSVVGGVEAAESAIDESLLKKARENKSVDSGQCGSCCCFRILKEIFNPELFVQWAFLLFLATNIPGATSQYLFQYIPTIAVYQGATKDEGATILTVCGFTDLVSRILTGLLADTHLMRPTQIVAISLICLGVVCQFNQLFTDFNSLIAMGVLIGVFVGTRQSLLPMMVLEIVGLSKMSRCLSITAVVGTTSVAAHSPALSAVVQSTGSFTIVLYYVGAAMILSAVLLLLTPLLARLDSKRGKNFVIADQANKM